MKRAWLLWMLMGGFLLGGGGGMGRAEAPKARKQEAVMVTREYRTPLNFLETGDAGKEAEYPYKRKTAKEVLEGWGVPFPEGAAAAFNMGDNRLVVRNTEENLEIVSYLVEERKKQVPQSVIAHATVIEGPGRLIREMNAAAARKMSAVEELDTLVGQAREKESQVRVVGDAWLVARPGRRAQTETARELSHAGQVLLDVKGHASLEMEMRPMGLRLDVEAYPESESQQIHLTSTLDLFPAPPTARTMSVSDVGSGNAMEFPVADVRCAQFTTSLALHNGDTKILGVARPAGTGNAEGDDVLWMAFITVRARPVEALQAAVAAAEPEAAPLPPADKKKESMKRLGDDGNGCAVGELDFYPTRPLTSFFTLHTVQATGPFLRALAVKAAAAGDHAGVWREIEAAAARGEVSFVDSHVLEAKSGVKAETHAAREWVYPARFTTDSEGLPEIEFEMREVGSRLSLEPTISVDAHSLNVEVDYELHTAPPNVHREVFRDAASKQPFEMGMPDFHTAHVETGVTMPSGGTLLLTLWKPAGRGDADVLWATFLHGEVVRQKAPEKLPSWEVSGTIPVADEKEWISRVFRVPPDFAHHGKSVKQVLKEVGISFPEGAKAYLSGKEGRLIVRAQRKEMDLVEAYIETRCGAGISRSLAFTTHVVQGPGALIRRVMAEVAGRCDHRKQMEGLLASAEVKHVGMSRIEAKPGVKAESSDVLEHKALAEPPAEQEMRRVGFMMTLEGTVQREDDIIELVVSTEFHTAEPQEHRELLTDTQGRRLEFPLTDYHAAKVTTNLLIPDGAAHLLGVWKPTGKPEFEAGDILQAVFITCDVLPVVVYQER